MMELKSGGGSMVCFEREEGGKRGEDTTILC